jgi:hypothetical protein
MLGASGSLIVATGVALIRGGYPVKRRATISILVAGLLMLCVAGVTSAAGRNSVRGEGTRDFPAGPSFTFSFDIVMKGDHVTGSFSWDNGQGLSYNGTATCGSVNGNIAVFGGDVTSYDQTHHVVFEVSDKPDGMIVGDGATPCDTSAFGVPAGLPISTGFIRITGPR